MWRIEKNTSMSHFGETTNSGHTCEWNVKKILRWYLATWVSLGYSPVYQYSNKLGEFNDFFLVKKSCQNFQLGPWGREVGSQAKILGVAN